jgi:hypothetical protein
LERTTEVGDGDPPHAVEPGDAMAEDELDPVLGPEAGRVELEARGRSCPGEELLRERGPLVWRDGFVADEYH